MQCDMIGSIFAYITHCNSECALMLSKTVNVVVNGILRCPKTEAKESRRNLKKITAEGQRVGPNCLLRMLCRVGKMYSL